MTMEIVLCDTHESPCFLKTGVRDGPNKGKSFYVCSAREGTPCGFTQPAEMPPSHCLHHEDSLVELQALVQSQQQGCYRLFFRCVSGKSEGKKWCGSIPWKGPEAKGWNPPADGESQCAKLPQERNPFKAPSKTGQPSEWRILQEGGNSRSEQKMKERGEREQESRKGGMAGEGRGKGKKESVREEKRLDVWQGTMKGE
ncbi:transcription termination factor 2-like [Megalops cyprinoides]|uniref:transcription termination factor 2-like n=1 Tax=Megalops cyprinoides TaxID=118141 RepID=UPI0018647C4A|nr:transcription termination factor 2-like [Megalops cyprinoides]